METIEKKKVFDTRRNVMCEVEDEVEGLGYWVTDANNTYRWLTDEDSADPLIGAPPCNQP